MNEKKYSRPVTLEESKKLNKMLEVDSQNGLVRLSPAQKAHMISLNKLAKLSSENGKI